MKKQLFIAALALGSIAFGQNTFPSSGNVGIGTATPAESLEIKNGFSFHNGGNKVLFFGAANSSGDTDATKYSGEVRFDPSNGNISLGSATSLTTLPTTMFTVDRFGKMALGTPNLVDQFQIGTGFSMADGGNKVIFFSANSFGDLDATKYSGEIRFDPTNGKMSLGASASVTSNPITAFTLDKNGRIGIGSSNPDEKLTVKGKIHAEEIKVDLAVPADYVFQKYFTGSSTLKPDYEMPSLNEIESFVKENHHLPNIPSAQEMQENGLQLGEMNNLLLQKVEELTLYIIEQNKRIEALEAKITEND